MAMLHAAAAFTRSGAIEREDFCSLCSLRSHEWVMNGEQKSSDEYSVRGARWRISGMRYTATAANLETAP